ncbi:MAG TPA: PilZ domain-containing protein [Allosphingosinicella sp.]
MFRESVDQGCIQQLRAEARIKVLLSGELRGMRGAVACRVHDISRGGACVDADQVHQVGESVTFHRGPLKVSGTIMWSRGKRFGLSFDEPIRATELFVQMSHSRKAAGQSGPSGAQPLSAAARSPFPSR